MGIIAFDNLYFQFNQGLLSEDDWLTYRGFIKVRMRNNIFNRLVFTADTRPIAIVMLKLLPMTEQSKAYNPKEVEEKWLKSWLENKLFKSTTKSDKESFSISLPPPNVTGNLHMGHAFGNTIQDFLIRYNRMNGKNVLWQAGTDHAGIATQVLVEKDIKKNEKKRKE